MKRCCLLLLALLHLSACGRAEPEAVTSVTPTTTEIETTAEKETKETTQQLHEIIKMETVTFIVLEKVASYNAQEIWLRDKASGEEVLLLGCGDIDGAIPCFFEQINERYFIYSYAIPDSSNIGDAEIYDLQKKRSVDIEYPEWVFIDRISDENIYLKTAQEDEEDVIIKTYAIDIADLDTDGPIIPEEVR